MKKSISRSLLRFFKPRTTLNRSPKESRTLLVTERRLNKTERERLRFRLFVNKIAIGRAGDESNNIIELCQRISWFKVQSSEFRVQGSRIRDP